MVGEPPIGMRPGQLRTKHLQQSRQRSDFDADRSGQIQDLRHKRFGDFNVPHHY